MDLWRLSFFFPLSIGIVLYKNMILGVHLPSNQVHLGAALQVPASTLPFNTSFRDSGHLLNLTPTALLKTGAFKKISELSPLECIIPACGVDVLPTGGKVVVAVVRFPLALLLTSHDTCYCL